MTAERFKLVEYFPNVVQIKDKHRILNSNEIVELLNLFYEENKELKKRLKALDDAFMDFEQKLYLEVFDIQLSQEDEKQICGYLQKLGDELKE